MTGLLLGTALLVNAAGLPPVPVPAHPSMPAPALTLRLPDDATMARWAREAPPRAAIATPRRENLTGRIIAVAAGASAGFFAGALIGGKITDRSDENPDDDTSVLKGIFIGAPIGAVVGGILGWTLSGK